MSMVVMVDALNCAMSVGVGTVLVSQLVPVFQSLVPGAALQTGGRAGGGNEEEGRVRAVGEAYALQPPKSPVVARR